MPPNLSRLIKDLFALREYRARRGVRLPWRIRIPYFRNLIRHQALEHWPGAYVFTTEGRFAYVPRHVDVTAGHRLFKPVLAIGLIETLCRQGDCVLDIGANVGDWTMPMALRVGPQGRVIAFEPVPYLAETIAKTARINRHDWVEVRQLALSASEGSAEFSVERGNSGGSRLGRVDGDFAQIKVATARLDSLLAARPDIERIDFIKIDVEGHEDQVLAGARETLARFRPPLVIESGFESAAQRRTIHDLLVGLRYDMVGAVVSGGVIEVSWQDYLDNAGAVAQIGLCNYLLMPCMEAGCA